MLRASDNMAELSAGARSAVNTTEIACTSLICASGLREAGSRNADLYLPDYPAFRSGLGVQASH